MKTTVFKEKPYSEKHIHSLTGKGIIRLWNILPHMWMLIWYSR